MDTAQGSSTWWKRATQNPETFAGALKLPDTNRYWKQDVVPKMGRKKDGMDFLTFKEVWPSHNGASGGASSSRQVTPGLPWGSWPDGNSPGKGEFTWERGLHLEKRDSPSPLHSHSATAWTTCRWNVKWMVNLVLSQENPKLTCYLGELTKVNSHFKLLWHFKFLVPEQVFRCVLYWIPQWQSSAQPPKQEKILPRQ